MTAKILGSNSDSEHFRLLNLCLVYHFRPILTNTSILVNILFYVRLLTKKDENLHATFAAGGDTKTNNDIFILRTAIIYYTVI